MAAVNGGASLKQLHLLHQQLQELQETLDRGPRQVKVRGQIVTQKQADVEAQKQKYKSLRMLADQKSLQLKSNEAKLGDLKVKLNQASSNKEFDSLRNQIAADTMSTSVLEDEILDTLEKVDEAHQQIGKLDQELATSKSEHARITAEVEAAAPGLKAQVAATQAKIAEKERELPGDIANQYKRLVQAYGPAAFAPVEGSLCTSCYVNIPPQQFVILKTGQIVICKTCGKLQYVVS